MTERGSIDPEPEKAAIARERMEMVPRQMPCGNDYNIASKTKCSSQHVPAYTSIICAFQSFHKITAVLSVKYGEQGPCHSQRNPVVSLIARCAKAIVEAISTIYPSSHNDPVWKQRDKPHLGRRAPSYIRSLALCGRSDSTGK